MPYLLYCDAPGCDALIEAGAELRILGPRSVKLRGAPGWSYQQESEPFGSRGAFHFPNLLGGVRAWEQAGTPTFYACCDDHLLAILKAAPTGSEVVEYNRLSVKAAALAAVLTVMAEDAAGV